MLTVAELWRQTGFSCSPLEKYLCKISNNWFDTETNRRYESRMANNSKRQKYIQRTGSKRKLPNRHWELWKHWDEFTQRTGKERRRKQTQVKLIRAGNEQIQEASCKTQQDGTFKIKQEITLNSKHEKWFIVLGELFFCFLQMIHYLIPIKKKKLNDPFQPLVKEISDLVKPCQSRRRQ